LKLALFFTRGISLEIWINQGLFDREKTIYEEHLKRGNFDKIYWLTYGSNDKKLANKLKKENKLHKDIEVLQMPKIFNFYKIGNILYSLFLPFIYRNELKNCDILKTNQMDGSWSAVLAKWIYKNILIVRTGYTLSLFKYKKNNKLKYKFSKFIEKFAYKYCNKAIVASWQDKQYLLKQNYLNGNKIEVIPNFIDIDIFKPLNIKKYKDRILFVGRLNEQKNVFNLIEAISETNLSLDIYGKGELKDELEKFAKKLNAKVRFKGVVPNNKLPKIYNKYKYYIIPSYFEGMPKTLLEAMACGCICIGTNVAGINEVIKNEVNGYLAENTSVKAIEKVIKKALENDNSEIIENGINTIREKFSLNNVINKEFNIIKNLFFYKGM
jgi:glycosyltransferase involved in cell wall biosynthesis